MWRKPPVAARTRRSILKIFATQAMERTQMPECLALASELFEQLGEVAMRLKRERVTLERTRETLHGIVELFTFAVRQPEPQMNFRVGGHKYGRAKQLANRTREVPLALQQR